MNILEMMLGGGQSSSQINQLARQFGIGDDQAQSVVEQVVPALSRGVKRNLGEQGGLESLIAALQKGNHQKYVDHPEILADSGTRDEGNAILGHLLGSKDVSRTLADRATGGSGLDSGMIKQMLPVVASMMMGSLSKQTDAGGMLEQGQGSGGLLDGLTGFLDADKDGSIADDLIGLAGKFFR